MKKVIQVIASIIALTVMAPGQADTAVTQSFIAKANETQSTGIIDSVVTGTRDRLDAIVQTLTEPWITFAFNKKDQECLAQNIFYEAANESEEGKVAVGIVTINRVKEGRFGKTICEVVNQRTVVVKTRQREETVTERGWFGRPQVRTVSTRYMEQVPVCQFSWKCTYVRTPREQDERWHESRRIAEELLKDGYDHWRVKYSEAIYFHATGIRPSWSSQKKYIHRIGGHIFYGERTQL